jgi:hypothetical protein
MEKFTQPMKINENIVMGTGRPVLFAGPCAVESFDICMEIGSSVKEYANELGFSYVFKASFDKANRTSATSFRSIGMDKSLGSPAKDRQSFGCSFGNRYSRKLSGCRGSGGCGCTSDSGFSLQADRFIAWQQARQGKP